MKPAPFEHHAPESLAAALGESGATGSPPCVFDAVADARALVGARIDCTPLGPQATFAALDA